MTNLRMAQDEEDEANQSLADYLALYGQPVRGFYPEPYCGDTARANRPGSTQDDNAATLLQLLSVSLRQTGIGKREGVLRHGSSS